MVKYYDPGLVISKQRNVNMIIGPRGYGKTYGYKKYCISRAIEYGEKFFYMRRRKTEIDAIKDFFGALAYDPKFTKQNIIFIKKGKELFYAYSDSKDEKDQYDWKHIGTIIALSVQSSTKSVEYPDYKNLIFDEWLPDRRGEYIKNEPEYLFKVLDTFFRLRDFRVFLIGNSTMLFNPYFHFYDFYPNPFKEFSFDKNKSMLIQIISSEEWSQTRDESPLGKLISGTDYAKFANDNQFLDDDDNLVEERTQKSQNIMVIKEQDYTIGVWYDRKTGYVYFSEEYNKGIKDKYAFDYDDLNPEYQTYRNLFESENLKILKRARLYGNIRFTTKKAKAFSKAITSRLNLL